MKGWQDESKGDADQKFWKEKSKDPLRNIIKELHEKSSDHIRFWATSWKAVEFLNNDYEISRLARPPPSAWLHDEWA